ncbi:ribonuclease P protein component [Fluviicola taffensis]|uniref:Ribonuclease P protein component n=1 Tax=Fluviicola taffensis (strain DSM 16823 / NCIMB 13979 / RW262) TaxID=755732 RepID=F2IDN1_FLUTR|nr:ribonuclease P protein component [Fluviicola taffensis]AEA43404.1 Ribonuclease P protein component [Fluviicola taffensis DSM 16823]
MDQSFGKPYKLCSRKTIDSLFQEGKQLRAFPLKLYYAESESEEKVPFQVVLSAPKRQFKRAHDRNYIKRLLKEVLRREKQSLEDVLNESGKKLSLFIIYTNKELPTYEEIERCIRKLIAKLIAELKSEG